MAGNVANKIRKSPLGTRRFCWNLVLSACAIGITFGAQIAHARQLTSPGPTLDGMLTSMDRVPALFDCSHRPFRIHTETENRFFHADGSEDTLRGSSDIVDYARKGPWLYVHLLVKPAGGLEPVDESIVWKDGVCVRRLNDTISIYPSLLPQAYGYLHYTDRLFVDAYQFLEWTPAQRRTHLGSNPSQEYFLVLPRMVQENRQEYRLRGQAEQIDGRTCVVLEWPDIDTIHLAPGLSHAVIQRQFSKAPGRKVFSWINRDFFEIEPGVYLPRIQEESRFHHADDNPELLGRIKRRSVTKLASISFDVQDSLFTLPVMDDEDTLIIDSVRKISYVRHAAGTDPVKRALVDASRRLQAKPKPLGNRSLLGGSVFGIALFVFMYQYLRTR